MFLGPVFWMELRARARRLRFFAARILITTGLSAVVCLPYLSFIEQRQRGTTATIQELAELGQQMFAAYAVAQFLVLLILAPAYCAGAITADRERRVLDLVFATQLTNTELVAGKFLVRVVDLCLLVVAGVPALAICLTLGGVQWTSLVAAIALTLVMIGFVASLSLMISIGSRRTITAVVITYMLLLIVWMAIPVMTMMLFAGPTGSIPSWLNPIMRLNPGMAIGTAVLPNFGASPWPDANWHCVRVYGLATLVLIVVDVLIVRRVGLWASHERVKRPTRDSLRVDRGTSQPPTEKQRAGRQRKVREVWNNPVAWREVRTIAVHRRMRWARILSLLMLILFSSPLWLAWLSDLLDGHQALSWDFQQFCMVIICTATIAWMLMVIQGAVSFAYEREHSTLDALLTTPLRSSYILSGKLAGILRSSAFALAFPVFFTVLAWGRDVISPRAAMLSLAIIIVGGLLAGVWGLFWSVRTGASMKAITFSMTTALALCVGVPLLSGLLTAYETREELLPYTLVSPTQNLSYGVWEEGNRSTLAYQNNRYYGPWGDWEYRQSAACMHVLLELALAVGLMALSTSRLEREYRIDPWLDLSLKMHRQKPGWKRRGWKILSWCRRHWRFTGVLLATVAVTLPLLLERWWDAYQVNRQLAFIRARGEPMTAAELHSHYARPPSGRDATRLWLSAGENLRLASSAGVISDFLTDEVSSRPPPPGVWEDLVSVQEFLGEQDAELKQLHEAAKVGGGARFDVRFEDGFRATVPHLQSLQGVSTVLLLEADVRAHLGDASGAADSLHAAFLAGEALRHEPLAVSQLERMQIHGQAIDELKQLLPAMSFTDEDFTRLKHDLESVDFHSAARTTLLGLRAQSWISFDEYEAVMPTTRQRIDARLWRQHDRKVFLEIGTAYTEATSKPWPIALEEVDRLIEGIDSRAILTREVFGESFLLQNIAYHAAKNRVALVAIALEQFRRQRGRPPKELSDLVPQFLAELPIDPQTNEPLVYLLDDDGKGYIVYSRSGPGLHFERSTHDPKTGAGTDISFRYPPLGGGPDIEPVGVEPPK